MRTILYSIYRYIQFIYVLYVQCRNRLVFSGTSIQPYMAQPTDHHHHHYYLSWLLSWGIGVSTGVSTKHKKMTARKSKTNQPMLYSLLVFFCLSSSLSSPWKNPNSPPWLVWSLESRFVLTHTDHAGNVGAAARAIQTMGFDDLVLVSPRDPKVLNRKRTKEAASGAMQVLKTAKICDTLEEALAGTDVWCATGMPHDMSRPRPYYYNNNHENDTTTQQPQQQRYWAPRKYFQQLVFPPGEESKQNRAPKSISFVFGNEREGMTEQDMGLCHVVLGIPTNPKFGSLNLASAVQLIAYDWREALGGFEDNYPVAQNDLTRK